MPDYVCFNNAQGHDHTRYGPDAFYDLALTGYDQKRFLEIQPRLNPGQKCIVASYAPDAAGMVIFKWYAFREWTKLNDPDKAGTGDAKTLYRVFIGRLIDETTPMSKPPKDTKAPQPYTPFFNRLGNFNQRSAFVATAPR